MSKEQKLTLMIDGDIQNLQTKIAALSNNLNKLGGGGKQKDVMTQRLNSMKTSLDQLQVAASKPLGLQGLKRAEKDIEDISDEFTSFQQTYQKMVNGIESKDLDLLPKGEKEKILGVQSALASLDKRIKASAQSSKELKEKTDQLAKARDSLATSRKKEAGAQSRVDKNDQKLKQLKAEKDALDRLIKTKEVYEKKGADKSGTLTVGKKTYDYQRDLKATGLESDDQASLAAAQQKLTQAILKTESALGKSNFALKEAQNETKGAEKAVLDLSNQTNALKLKDGTSGLNDDFVRLKEAAKQAGFSVDKIGDSAEDFDDLKQRINSLDVSGFGALKTSADGMRGSIDGVNQDLREMGSTTQNTTDALEKQNDEISNVSGIVSRIQQYTGLIGVMMIARRAFQQVMQTVKDLDAVMTEMAVVTDLGVGDYWKMLPEFTDNANALGVSIHDAYEATTLYLQQGLKMAQAQELANKTLEMGRIAGLEAADATDRMTAALRGFNMELNEASAQKVADVYSKLAAITASDVDEISVAMTKTASIASSAGMEFETTAAFLSQIIETTRESAETAGTAMKTVIARFQELKKDPAEIGEVDGEVVDANQIETALRSVGVALRDTDGQFRQLDQVFLELAEKWDGLTTNTQRYIATIAAGSRQQSRFIAMMQDYERTSELVTAANNSAGASTEQFEKTLESLESKLAQLTNAWDSFLMGVANNEIIKGAVDLLTAMMTALNNVTNAMGSFAGPAKILIVVGALLLADKALKAFLVSFKATGSIATSFGAAIKGTTFSLKGMNASLERNNKALMALSWQHKIATKSNAKMIAASREYRQALIQETISQYSLDEARKKGNLTKTEEQQKIAAVTNSTKLRTQAESNLYAAMNLTEAEKKEAIAMTKKGTLADTAAVAASLGITTAEIAETAQTRKCTEEEAAQYLIKQKTNKQTILGTMLTWSDIVSKKMAELGTKNFVVALWALAKAKGEEIKKTLAEIAANLGLQASMWPILVIGLAIVAMVAALIVLVIGIIELVKYFISLSPEAKLEKAAEALKATAEAAEQAQEKFDNLNDSLEELGTKYDALEDLTIGTIEWKKAVADINKQVLELIDAYPELAKFVTNQGGVLTIDVDSDNLDVVTDKYYENLLSAQNAELAAKMYVSELQQQVDYNALNDQSTIENEAAIIMKRIDSIVGATVVGTSIDALTGGATGVACGSIGGTYGYGVKRWRDIEAEARTQQNQTKEIAKMLASGGLYKDGYGGWAMTKEAERIAKELGLTTDQVVSFAHGLGDYEEELRDYGASLKSAELQNEVYAQQVAQNAVAMMDMTKKSLKQQEKILAVADNEYAEYFQNQQKAVVDAENFKDAGTKAQYEKYVKEIYGEDARLTDSGSIEIKNEDGEWKERVDAQSAKAILATAAATEKMANLLENLPRGLEKANQHLVRTRDQATAKAFERVFLGSDGSELTATDLKNLEGIALEELWENNADLQKAFDNDFSLFKEDYLENIKQASDNFDAARKNLNALGTDAENFEFGDITSKAAKGYSEKLEIMFARMGTEATKNMNTTITNMQKILGDSYSDFLAELNAIDWTDSAAWGGLRQRFEAIGLSIPDDKLDRFIQDMKEAAGAISKTDLSTLTEQTRKLQSILKQIKSGEITRTLDEEAYNALIGIRSELQSGFIVDLEGNYVYLGDSINDLKVAIEENTKAVLREQTDILKDKTAAGEILAGQSKEYNKEINNQDISTKRSYINDFMDLARNKGIDLNNLGIELLGEGTEVSLLKDDQVKTIVDGLVGLEKDYFTNSQSANTSFRNFITSGLLNNDISVNASGASNMLDLLELGKVDLTEFEAYTKAVAAQANDIGITQALIDQYDTVVGKLVELQDAGDYTSAEYQTLRATFEALNVTMANKVGHKNVIAGLQGIMENADELIETYKKLGSVESKMSTVSEMMSKFSLSGSVTEDNYEEYYQLYVDLIEGRIDGYQKLLQESAKQAGLNLSSFYNATFDSFTKDFNSLSKEEQAWVQSLVDNGLLQINTTAAGAKTIIAASAEVLLESANVMGTIYEEWENDYNWMYVQEQYAKSLSNELDILERKYARLEGKDAILGNRTERATNLARQKALTETLKATADYDIGQLLAKNSEFASLINEDGQLDAQAMMAYEASITTDEQREAFDTFIDQFTELQDISDDAEKTLLEIEDDVEALVKQGRDEFIELTNNIADALKDQFQEQIDGLSDINDSIQSAQESLISTLQDQINQQRQERENRETEEELFDMQSKLAALGMDTSGGNAVAILDAQEQLQDKMQSYQDKLVDQSIAEMQDANKKAAEQRQAQIDLQQSIYDRMEENGEFEQKAQEILEGGLGASGGILETFLKTGAGELVAKALGLDTQDGVAREKTLEDLDDTFREAFGFSQGDTQDAFDDAYEKNKGAFATALGTVFDANGEIIRSGFSDVIDLLEKMVPEETWKDKSAITAEKAMEALGDNQRGIKTKPLLEKAMDYTGKTYGDYITQSKNGTYKVDYEAIEQDASRADAAAALGRLKSGGRYSVEKGYEDSRMDIDDTLFQQYFSSSPVDYYLANGGAAFKEKLVEGQRIRKAEEITGMGREQIDAFLKDAGYRGIEMISSADTNYGGAIADAQNNFELLSKEIEDYGSGAIGIGMSQIANSEGEYFSEKFVKQALFRVANGQTDGYLDLFFEAAKRTYAKNIIRHNLTGKGFEQADIEKALGFDHMPPDTNLKYGFISAIEEQFDGELPTSENDLSITIESLGSDAGDYVPWFLLRNFDEYFLKFRQSHGFKTGGLADFTGPAWLDGTKSKPEIVLNQSDSANFLQLRDILSDILNGSGLYGSGQPTNGDNYFDIEINVEQLGDDYDVEQVADKVRSLIYDDAMYRNVNAVDNSR